MTTELPERLPSVCPSCSAPFTRDGESAGAYCTECRPANGTAAARRLTDLYRGTRHERGYDNAWLRLSARARKRQPFCLDCGATDDLTTDHSAEAWRRKAEGKVIRLKDVDVVCRRCNSERGDPMESARHPRGMGGA